MGMVIQHNMSAVNAKNKLTANIAGLKKSSEKLASGYRINRAGDDAPGLAVSEKMRSQIRGLNQAVRNSQDAINLVQTFEGALGETHSILQRCKELAAESANCTYDGIDRAALQLELNQLIKEINNIADTDFNGVCMINGNPSVKYVDTVVAIPVGSENYSPVFDENGNPLLDAESYRINADYDLNSPFGTHGNFAPKYNVNGTTVRTEYGSGSTDFFNITLNGTYTSVDENGNEVQTPRTFRLNSPTNDISLNLYSGTDENGNFAYYSEKIVSLTLRTTVPGNTDENGEAETVETSIQVKLLQKAVPRVEYLTDAGGNEVLDENGAPVPTSLQWDIGYEFSMTDNSDPNFSMESLSLSMFSDTILQSDSEERYFTSDNVGNGSLDHEVVYEKPFAIDSFSSYYFDLDNPTFNDISNRIQPELGDSGPDKLKLGLYSHRDALSPLSPINEGNDLAYTMYWENRVPVNGVISLSAGSRGLANTYGDTNISPKMEIDYIEEIVTNAVTTYNDVDLTVQAGSRSKDSVNFTFEYKLNTAQNLKPDLNCTSAGLGLDNISIDPWEAANQALDSLDDAISKVSMVRASFGATQNRLEHKVNNLVNTNENMIQSESEIRDTDMATEMMKFTKSGIVQQAAQSVLAQVNQLPQAIIQLLV